MALEALLLSVPDLGWKNFVRFYMLYKRQVIVLVISCLLLYLVLAQKGVSLSNAVIRKLFKKGLR